MKTLVFDMVENIVGTGGKAGFQHFLFPQHFPKPSYIGQLNLRTMWHRVKLLISDEKIKIQLCHR